MKARVADRKFYVIAYDIPSDRRRTKVHRLLCGFGRWTQYSLFECFLSEREIVQLQHKLSKLIDKTEDSVRFYPLCAACLQKVATTGAPPHEDVTYLI